MLVIMDRTTESILTETVTATAADRPGRWRTLLSPTARWAVHEPPAGQSWAATARAQWLSLSVRRAGRMTTTVRDDTPRRR